MKKLIIAGLLWGLLTPGLMWAEDVQSQAPQLLPFNQTLFNDYCCYKATESGRAGEQLFYISMLMAAVTVVGVWSIPYAKDQSVRLWGTFLGSSGIGSSLWQGSSLTYSLYMGLNSLLMIPSNAKATYTNAKMWYNGDYDAKRDHWNYLVCAPYDQQVKLWHEIVYEKLGRPVVHGAIQEGISYKLKFSKKQGIGVIFLDPYDIENISVLLGIHADKRDSCVCSDIYIV